MALRMILALLAVAVVQAVGGDPNWPGSCLSSDTADKVLTGTDLSGKVIVITGADGNIAGEVSLALAKAKATVVLACRTPAKCEAVRKHIADVTGLTNTTLEVEQLDLSSQANIRAFAERIVTKHTRIDVLINSAGTYGTFMTHDQLVAAMEINLLGPALLSNLLLPALRGGQGRPNGRVVNVAAATYGISLPKNITAAGLAAYCTKVDPVLNSTGAYFQMSKYLMTHHAAELARREPNVVAFALNPGVGIFKPGQFPDWLKHAVTHAGYPNWLKKLIPESVRHFIDSCSENEAGLQSCPQDFSQSAGVVVFAAARAGIESFSGSYLDYDTKPLPPDAPQVYGPFVQREPTCTPRQPVPMDLALRSAWYDEMLRLMQGHSTVAAHETDIVV